MKTLSITVSGVLFLIAATFLISSHKPTFAQTVVPQPNPALTLNTVSLNLTSAQLDPLEGNGVIRAFVPTGSKSVNCLASLNEIRTNVFPTGITLFCGEREPFAFGSVPGVLVSIFFTQPAPPDLTVSVTLYQLGADKYGTPVLCTANDGC
jgi:hypothetical protein